MQRTFIALRELVELKRLFGGSLQFRRRQSPVQGRGRRSPSVRAVVEGIEAGVVVVAVERNPVGSIDASAGGGGGASRIRGGDLEPPPGGSGDCADLGGDFCEILILAEYRSDVELAGAGHADEVEGKAEVDAFLAGNKTRTRWEEPSWAAMVSGWYRRGRDVTWMLARRMAMRRRVQ